MPYTPILVTLGYVFSPNGEEVLMIHRNARPEDTHFGKYNGLGGKLEPDEDIVAGLRREIFEEANIHCDKLELAGTISWSGFGRKGEDMFGFLFRILEWSGEIRMHNREGTLHWVPISEVLNLNLWAGDRHFLPMILDRSSTTFHGAMPYCNGSPVSWSCTNLD